MPLKMPVNLKKYRGIIKAFAYPPLLNGPIKVNHRLPDGYLYLGYAYTALVRRLPAEVRHKYLNLQQYMDLEDNTIHLIYPDLDLHSYWPSDLYYFFGVASSYKNFRLQVYNYINRKDVTNRFTFMR